jgi:hypothetical protein
LVQEGLVAPKKLAEAFQRQVIYGGTLDTILLELDAVDEEVLLDALGRAAGLPMPEHALVPPALERLQLADALTWFPQATSERFCAVPVDVDGATVRVLVLDPPDRRLLEELAQALGRTVDPAVVTEHRFASAASHVYGQPLPARFAALQARVARRLLLRPPPPPVRAPVPPPAPEPAAPREELPPGDSQAYMRTRAADAERAESPSRAERARPRPEPKAPEQPTAPGAPAVRRAIVTDVPLPPGGVPARPAAAPSEALEGDVTPRIGPPLGLAEASRAAGTPAQPIGPAYSGPIDPSVAGPIAEAATPMSVAEAVAQIDLAADRDQIFATLCRGARAHTQFAAVFTLHGELAIGKMALGERWIERDVLANVSVAIDRSPPFRAAVEGRAPYLGRIGEDALGAAALGALGRKGPTPALLLPVVLRERTVALLYGDAGGAPIAAQVHSELTALGAPPASPYKCARS